MLDWKLKNGVVTNMIWRGGAGLSFVLENLQMARGCDLVVIMAGGNDIDAGAPYDELCEMMILIWQKSRSLNIGATLFLSHWPRENQVYNDKIESANQDLRVRFGPLPNVAFWQWDRRLPLERIDSVHLADYCYESAIKYLFGAIKWAFDHLY